MKHKIELFRANCRLCDYTESELKKAVCDECEVIVHRPEDCIDGSCCIKAENYGIKAVPSIVVDGKLAHVGKLSAEEFKKYI